MNIYQELYEAYFVFALVWAYGSSLYNDGQTDYRAEFRLVSMTIAVIL